MNTSPDHQAAGVPFDRLRLLGLERIEPEQRAAPSCVMLQIDGLSYRNFRKALQTGKLPFLARLIKKKAANAGPWHSMLPTSTSAFQTGLFYGNNDNIPGFFWFDKLLRRRIKMNGSEDTARLEEDVRRRVAPYPGLLAGGSSYSALFIGGAEYNFLTFARLFSPRFNLSVKPRRLLLFLLSQLLLLGRILYYSAIEICLAVYDVLRTLFTHKNRAAEFKFIFPRILSVVVCRELATLATILDIQRGVGPIYLNYFAYDEHAHLRGPDSRFAFWTLRGIDASIRRIWRATEKARDAGIRHYDVFVWSDHGQTASVPFQELFMEDPERHFDQLFRAIYGPVTHPDHGGDWRLMTIRQGRPPKPPRRGAWSPGYVEMQAQRADQLSSQGPGWLRWLLNPLIRPGREIESYLERLFPADPERRLRLVSTGPVAFLCLDDSQPPLSYEAWLAHYPFFMEIMAQHKGIGFTLVRTRAGGCRAGIDGKWIDLNNSEEIRRAMPLGLALILLNRRAEFIRWANMPNAGDLLLFGMREPDRRSITYSYEHGSHGGPSPQETTPFILVPAAVAAEWPEVKMEKPGQLVTLQDLHERLRRAYQPSADAEPESGPPFEPETAAASEPLEEQA